MDNVTVGQYLSLKAQEKTLFNGLQWCISKKNYKPLLIMTAATDLKIIRERIQTIEVNLREKLQNKKTIAKATA